MRVGRNWWCGNHAGSRKRERVGGVESELPGQESCCSASPFTAGSHTASFPSTRETEVKGA